MPKVKVYSTPTCGFCKAAKQFLKDNSVEFESIDVSADQRAAEEMIEKTGQMGVPVIEVDNEVIIGFDKAKLEKLLKLKPKK